MPNPKLNPDIQHAILAHLSGLYPQSEDRLGRAFPTVAEDVLAANLRYLEEHGRIQVKWFNDMSEGRKPVAATLTANGADFLVEGEPGEQVPPLPQQKLAPYFTLDKNGVVNFAPPSSIDSAGNNLSLLEQLHQPLINVARELVSSPSKGNQYPALLKRVSEYLATIDKPLETLSFGLVFAMGVILENAVNSTREEIARGELPHFDASWDANVRTLITLNGAFVQSSAEGQLLVATEARYRRTLAAHDEAREAATSLAQEFVARPDIVAPKAAEFVQELAREVGMGGHPERTAMLGGAAVGNVMAVIVAAAAMGAPWALSGLGAVVGGVPGAASGFAMGALITKAFEKSDHGAEAIKLLSDRFDAFVAAVKPKWSRFARTTDTGLLRFLDWLTDRTGSQARVRARQIGQLKKDLADLDWAEAEAQKIVSSIDKIGEGARNRVWPDDPVARQEIIEAMSQAEMAVPYLNTDIHRILSRVGARLAPAEKTNTSLAERVHNAFAAVRTPLVERLNKLE